MGVEFVGAPRFVVRGDAAKIRQKAEALRERAVTYGRVASALGSLSTDGWTGRAADRFREHFEVDPPRWQEASSGFHRAASALGWYAQDLQTAQAQARACRNAWKVAVEATARAKAAWEADVARVTKVKAAWEAENGPGTYHVTIEPFRDPQEERRRQIAAQFKAVVAKLNVTAQLVADQIRAGCANAPKKRNWFQSAWANFTGFIRGGIKSATDFVEFVASPFSLIADVAIGDLTAEEAAVKGEMALEDVRALTEAFVRDPMGFGKEMFKTLTNWDQWKDDPAGAAGGMATNLGVSVVGGGGLLAGGKKLSSMTGKTDGITDTAGKFDKVNDVTDGSNALDKANEVADAKKTILPVGDGPVIFKPMKGATDEQIEQYKAYVDGCNRALIGGFLSEKGRVSTKGSLAKDAAQIARKERELHPERYIGKSVGHVPDTTWTNNADPPEWMPIDPKINSSLGGQANRYPLGFKPTSFHLDEAGGELYGGL